MYFLFLYSLYCCIPIQIGMKQGTGSSLFPGYTILVTKVVRRMRFDGQMTPDYILITFLTELADR